MRWTKATVVAVALAALVAMLSAASAVTQSVPAGPVTVQKKLIDSPLDDIQWADTKTVFVLSEQGQVYRSTDGGASWTSQGPKLVGSTDGGAPLVRSIHISPCDPYTVFLMGRGQDSWVTRDMGKTFVLTQALQLHEVKMHPRQSGWMLGGSMSSGCQQAEERARGQCHKKLYVTKDAGKTWSEAVSYAVQFDWAQPLNKTKRIAPAAPAPAYADPEPVDLDNLVYSTVHEVKQGNQKFGTWDANIHLYESYDFFQTSLKIVPHGNRFLFGDRGYLFVAAVHPEQETEVSLRVSIDQDRPSATKKGVLNRVHTFVTAILPVELTEHSYTILDTSDGTVFLHVNHKPFDLNAPTGHVYVSDSSGTQYSLSLPYNHRSGDGKCDFEKVEGLEGIFLANFIDENADDGKVWDEGQVRDGAGGAGGQSARSRSRAKTVITFDKGGIWSYLEPPAVDSAGKKVQCSSRDCHLHLHGITDLYGPFYSSATATGLIMATGTVGAYLQENVDRINTYLSRDAGLTWFEVAKGSHIYEFGDHGGLIVMAYDEGETDSVLYSWDQGMTWKELKISDSPIQVENIIIEPLATSQQFVVYGWQEDRGVLVYLDFGELHQRECQGYDAPDSSASDYETWTPSDGRLGGKCLMGHRVSYTRRKRDAGCFNTVEFERSVQVENCLCTEEDFECDFGYFRKLEGGACQRDPNVEPLPEPPAECSGSYGATKGYRRVAGDTCIGGADWDKVVTPCPGWVGGSWFGKLVLLLLVGALLGLCATSCLRKSELVEDCVDSLRQKFQRQSYWEVGKNIPHSMADDDFGADDQEFGQGAHLISDRGGGGGGGGGMGGMLPSDEHTLKPLPERRGRKQQAVPKLSGPPTSTSDDDAGDD